MKQPSNNDHIFAWKPIAQTSGQIAGFTFVELLVAVAVGAMVLGAAVLCFSAIGASQNRMGTCDKVDIGYASTANFYYLNTNALTVWFAPNYGRLMQADVMREKFVRDLQKTMAVYCLPRTEQSSIRPSSFTLSGSYAVTNFDLRRLDTPEAFRQLLASQIPASTTVFTTNAFTSTGSVKGKNLSIFMVSSVNYDSLYFDAIYEVDFVRATNAPTGTYATVRRYAGEKRVTPDEYYDIFYPDPPNGTVVDASNFYTAASFELTKRAGSSSSPLTNAVDTPFYFVWWPDPTSVTLPVTGTNYKTAMPGQSAYFMVVPMFPPL